MKRRTNKEIEIAVFEAAESIIEEVGFANITIAAITERASITPKVFYRWYGDMDGFLEIYTRKFDHWLSDILEYKGFRNKSPKDYYLSTMIHLADSLIKNKSIQQLLIWEMTADNSITRRSKKMRELNATSRMKSFEELFKDTQIDIRARTALLIGGIYYTVLTRDRSEFCGIDLTEEKFTQRIYTTITDIVEHLFQPIHNT